LGKALLLVNGDSGESRAVKEKARKLADFCNEYGGWSIAAETILEMCVKKRNLYQVEFRVVGVCTQYSKLALST
jgi:hypothetical protein